MPGSRLAGAPLQSPATTEAGWPSDDALARSLRGLGPLGLLAMLVIVLSGNVVLSNMVVLPIGAVLVLVWVWRSRTPWSEIGYTAPEHWIRTVIAGLALGIVFKLLMKMLVMPILGADPVNQAYHFLAGNRALLPTAIWAMLVAGFAEETVFRGYLFERLGKLFGTGVGAQVSIVLLTSAWFGLGHYANQGVAGVQQATIVGLVFGTMFAFRRRVLMLIVAHAAFDLTALAIIYWDLESDVAHLIFK